MTVTHARSETADGDPAGPPAGRRARAREALARARDHLLSLQHEQGWWQGELETNVTMDAEDLLMREFLGAGDAAHTAAEARWIRSQQREDGTWANFYGGPGDLSTTIEAYVALRLAGDAPSAPHMARAAEWIRAQGGLEASRVFTRIWMAMFGEWPWDDLPVIPPELIYLPAWFPLNIYDWGCWARQTHRRAGDRLLAAPGPQAAVRHRRNCAPASPRGSRPATRGRWSSTASTGPCTPTSAAAWPAARAVRAGPSGGPRCAAARTGSSPGRSGTAAGAASSRPGCTR